MRRLALTLGLLAALLLPAGSQSAAANGATAFASSQTIPARGSLPPGGRTAIVLDAARGEHEGAWIVARGGGAVAASVERDSLGPLAVDIAWGHFVDVGGRRVADALLPWGGEPKAAEAANQPLYVRVTVPRDAPAGAYAGRIVITANGRATTLPLSVRVSPVVLPDRAIPTSFHVSPGTYVAAVSRLYGLHDVTQRRAAHAALFRFLADYGLSPSSWGFGEPRSTAGYQGSTRWWLDSATLMREAAAPGFAAMRIPISSNRTSAGSRIAGLDPNRPETWCDYLRSVRAFWEQQGWLGRLPFLYAQDEPDLAGQRLLARQSKVLHSCWPGARTLVTGNPSASNRFLSDGRNGDDVDIWVVLSRRFYGQYTVPLLGRRRERELARSIEGVRRRAAIWSYTYGAASGKTPGFSAREPLSNPRMFLLWNAMEGIQGMLYGQGATSYDAGNPLDRLSRGGEFVLLYPGPSGPIPSARLEQIRDGLEDWAILDLVRRRHGAGEVRAILGGAGLFSAGRAGVTLGCTMGCALRRPTKFSWPAWSHDATTAARIERAHAAALRRAR